MVSVQTFLLSTLSYVLVNRNDCVISSSKWLKQSKATWLYQELGIFHSNLRWPYSVCCKFCTELPTRSIRSDELKRLLSQTFCWSLMYFDAVVQLLVAGSFDLTSARFADLIGFVRQEQCWPVAVVTLLTSNSALTLWNHFFVLFLSLRVSSFPSVSQNLSARLVTFALVRCAGKYFTWSHSCL